MGVNLLLFRKSLKTGWKRLSLVTGSVAIGIWILLSFTAIFNAMSNEQRYAFMNNVNLERNNSLEQKKRDGIDPVYLMYDYDKYKERDVSIMTIEKTGENAPDMVGLTVPNVGQYYVSPALDKLIRENPEDNLGSRYGNQQLGILPESMVYGQDELVVVRGSGSIKNTFYNDENDRDTGRGLIYTFSDKVNPDIELSAADKLSGYIIYMGIIILLLPIIMLISISAKLGSIQREKRYAALRLVGATNRQIITIMATESLISAILGVIIGSLLYVVSLPLLGQFSLEETRYWPSQIVVRPIQYVVIITLTLLLVWLSNWWGMRKIHTSPLGITQNDHREKKPGWWRFIPLAIGLGLIGYIQTLGSAANRDDSMRNVLLIMAAIVLIMFGLVLAGPWLTYVLSKLTSRFAHKATTIVGMKYVQAHARAISRSVIGVTLALFAGSFFIASTSGVNNLLKQSENDNGFNIIGDSTALITISNYDIDNSSNHKYTSFELVKSVEDKLGQTNYIDNVVQLKNFLNWSIGECKAVSLHIPKTDCSGNNLVAIDFNAEMSDKDKLIYANNLDDLEKKLKTAAKTKWDEPGYNLSDETINESLNLSNEPTSYRYLVGVTDDNAEKLRTLIATIPSPIQTLTIMTNNDIHDNYINPMIDKMSGLVYAGIGVTMVVAIICIVVSTTGGLLERRRSLYTLRLSGMQVNELKRMIMIESLAPLVVTSLLAAGIGIWVAIVFINNNSTTLRVNITPLYLAILFGSIIIAAVAIYLILPLLGKITDPANNQTE